MTINNKATALYRLLAHKVEGLTTVGVDSTPGHERLLVYVRTKTDAKLIESTYEGVPVEVIVVGRVTPALSEEDT